MTTILVLVIKGFFHKFYEWTGGVFFSSSPSLSEIAFQVHPEMHRIIGILSGKPYEAELAKKGAELLKKERDAQRQAEENPATMDAEQGTKAEENPVTREDPLYGPMDAEGLAQLAADADPGFFPIEVIIFLVDNMFITTIVTVVLGAAIYYFFRSSKSRKKK